MVNVVTIIIIELTLKRQVTQKFLFLLSRSSQRLTQHSQSSSLGNWLLMYFMEKPELTKIAKCFFIFLSDETFSYQAAEQSQATLSNTFLVTLSNAFKYYTYLQTVQTSWFFHYLMDHTKIIFSLSSEISHVIRFGNISDKTSFEFLYQGNCFQFLKTKKGSYVTRSH